MTAAAAQAGGTSDQTRVEQLVDPAAPASSACDEAALAVQPVVEVLVELGVRVEHERPVARADDREVHGGEALERAQVAAQRARVGRDEDAALAEDGVAGEAAPRPATKARWSGAWPGVATTVSGPTVSPSPTRASAPAKRAAATVGTPPAAAQRLDAAGVVGVVVGQRDAADAAAVGRRRRGRASRCAASRRAGVDDPARVAPDEPRVRALERVRPRVVGADECDVVLGELLHRRRS